MGSMTRGYASLHPGLFSVGLSDLFWVGDSVWRGRMGDFLRGGRFEGVAREDGCGQGSKVGTFGALSVSVVLCGGSCLHVFVECHFVEAGGIEFVVVVFVAAIEVFIKIIAASAGDRGGFCFKLINVHGLSGRGSH